MKVAVMQPYYSLDINDTEKLFRWELDELDKCDESIDIIVMPESSDMPAFVKTKKEHDEIVRKNNKVLLEKVKETAIRCNAIVFVNCRYADENGCKNTTYAFNRKGEIVGKYFKRHLTAGEKANFLLDDSYSEKYSKPYVIELDGIRFGFLTCYDFYFYESFSAMARENIDVIIGCSHQRSDTHDALEIINKFLCYNTNAYLLRASVSLGEDSPVGGGSMVVAPTGEILLNMENRIGLETVAINPKEKHYKPAGFRNSPTAHWEYIEKGRTPWEKGIINSLNKESSEKA